MNLVLLPGWGLGSAPLSALSDALGGMILDLPGYGQTDFCPNFDLAVQRFGEMLSPKTTLIGWSLGAMLSLATAARFPEKIAKLVLIAGTASFLQRDNWIDAQPLSVLNSFKTGISSDTEKTLSRFITGFNRGDIRGKTVTQTLLELIDKEPKPTLETLLTGLDWLRDTDLRADLSNVKAPTLLVHGAADPLMPLAAAESLATTISQAKLVVVAESAHAPFISQADTVLSHLRCFLHDNS